MKSQIYETLVRLDENNEVQPCLAESWEYEDDQTLIFKLRKGVKFHNGEELKASDVIFSYKRAFEDKTAGYVNLTNMDIDKSLGLISILAAIIHQNSHITLNRIFFSLL